MSTETRAQRPRTRKYRMRRTPLMRFAALTNTSGPIPERRPELGQCHLWTGSLYSDGYSKFWFEGRSVRGARWICETTDGEPIPDGHEPDHLYGIRACVRRDHLEIVTKPENLRRAGALRRGRRVGAAVTEAAKTHCPDNHPYDEENTRISRDGKRHCRTCDRNRHSKNGAAR